MMRAVTFVRSALAILLTAWAASSAAQATYSEVVTISVTLERENPPTWRLEASEVAIRQLGILREGDRVVLTVEGGGKETLLGRWAIDYRYFSHETCRTSWFKKKCKRHYATSPCIIPYSKKPLSPEVRTTVRFAKEGVSSSDETPDEERFSQDRQTIRYEPRGPRELAISGRFQLAKPECKDRAIMSKPELSRVKGPYIKGSVMGRGNASPWFNVLVTVKPPALED